MALGLAIRVATLPQVLFAKLTLDFHFVGFGSDRLNHAVDAREVTGK